MSLQPLPLHRVTVDGPFWAPLIRTVREVMLPFMWNALNDRIPGAEKSHAVANFRAAASGTGQHYGCVFQDSDLGKWIEAVAYSLATHPDPALEKAVDEAVDAIASAQQPDGYLNTYFTLKEPGKRWTNLRDQHELYCAGHLMEGAVAYFEATGKHKYLDVMCRYADLIAKTFGPKKGQINGYCGHEEVELALVKLYRVTGKSQYLDVATHFINARGTSPNFFVEETKQRGLNMRTHWNSNGKLDYWQAHLPVRDQKAADGHSVRAMYLYTGMADIAAATGDTTLLNACRRLWDNMTTRRMYVTGGIGANPHGERFSADYDLPNDTAYNETCASIGLIFWAHRMLHLDLDSRYADTMELALYNGVLPGMSMDGRSFYYANPLLTIPTDGANAPRCDRHMSAVRQAWFGCACCPPNLARLLTSLGSYAVSQSRSEACVHLYQEGTSTFAFGNSSVALVQKTGYPWKETVRFTIKADKALKFTLSLRIPAWCRTPSLRVNGRVVRIAPLLRKGYARLHQTWTSGDTIELTLPMPVERVEANPKVCHDAGRIALQRGPLVYCLEEADNGTQLSDVRIPRSAAIRAKLDRQLFGGTIVLAGKGFKRDVHCWDKQLYRTEPTPLRSFSFKAIPYFLRANRGEGEMAVWLLE